jgi:hypothetical protein
MRQNRYPGVKPFERSEENIFFGRDEDIQSLYELILLEKLVVLFGKSGYGKSSLLNAGILPLFEDGDKENAESFRPITIRFGNYVEGQNDRPPLDVVRQRVEETLDVDSDQTYLDDIVEDKTLWFHFKKRQSENQHSFLLVFDQFEELFSYPPAQVQAFKRQLAGLLYTAIPQSVRDAADDLADDDYDRLVEPLNIKTVFAIRSDRLSDLDQLKDSLPAILRKRYELKPLQPGQAREAVVNPASLKDDKSIDRLFFTPPFSYTPEALSTILEALSAGEHSGIESFQLQIICQYIERLVRDGEIRPKSDEELLQVSAEQLPDLTNIYEEYYKRQIALLDDSRQKPAQLVVEEGLLLGSPETGDARRLSVDGGALVDRYRNQGVDQGLLDTLVDAFLLRREPNTTGGFNYEISHDTLLDPVLKAKTRRLEAEQKEREAQELIQREQELKEERRKRQRATLLAILGFVLAAVAIIASIFAVQQTQKAQAAGKIAKDRLEAYEEAERKRKAAELIQIIRGIEEHLAAENWELARMKIEDGKAIDSLSIAILELEKQLNELERE